MVPLPIITAIGGINAAGRSSGHHSYRRLVYSALPIAAQQSTVHSLAALTGKLRHRNAQWRDDRGAPAPTAAYLDQIGEQLLGSSLIRKLEANLFDPEALLSLKPATLSTADDRPLEFEIRRRHLPSPLPAGWQIVTDHGAPDNKVWIRAEDSLQVILPSQHSSTVNSAGQLPSGFDPASLYQARNHPRALQMMVYAASDAINALGVDWAEIQRKVPADQMSVYAGSGLGQLDGNGFGGMLQARLLGKKVSSKQLPLGYAEMPADFINAYLLGNLGTTGTNVAACATFLYNLRQGIRDIQTGSHRLVIVGTSEAPLVPEVFEGFANMGALADDAGLRSLDGLGASDMPDHRRACRPFGNNCGFTLAESAQCAILMDDALALELGCKVMGAVNDVFINADGHKKSIASPGLGNYLSMAKAAAATRAIIGDDGLRQRSYVQAHGTGTPQNRLTESHILDEVAAAFGIEKWPVSAIKSYLGHSLASSAGDQLAASLGVFADGWIPGITSTDSLADDVSSDRLDFLLKHGEVGANGIDAVLINSKGFGGNNASASVLSPQVTLKMLARRHGRDALHQYQTRHESVLEQISNYDQRALAGENDTIYKFDHEVLSFEDIDMNAERIHIRGRAANVSLAVPNHYQDMLDQD